jgi:polar amino acid transport system substrate-binding protein
MKKSLFIGFLLVSMLLIASCAPKAQASHMEAITQAGKMVVGTSADFAPYEFIDEAGNIVGFDVDVINEIGKRMGLEVEITDMPFDSLLAAVAEGKIDLTIAGLNYTEERDQTVDFTEAYQESYLVLVVKEDFAGKVDTLEDLAQYNYGTQTGTTGNAWITSSLVEPGLLPAEKLFTYDRWDQAFLDLKAGRVDICPIDNLPGEAVVKEMGGLKLIELPDIFEVNPLNIVVPEGDVELQKALNEVIAEIKADGTLAELEQKWLVGE